MNVGEVLRETARRLPDKKAVTYGSRSITFRELDRAAEQVARFLARQKVGKGTRVGIIFPNIPEFVPVYLGIARLGAIGAIADDLQSVAFAYCARPDAVPTLEQLQAGGRAAILNSPIACDGYTVMRCSVE